MSRKENKKPERKKNRTLLGGFHAKMSVPDGVIPDGFVGRWVNDVENRIQMFINNDYQFVESNKKVYIGDGSRNENTDIGTKISKIVGTDKTGNPVTAYLMMQREEWYNEDQLEKQKKVDEIDEAIKTPGFGAGSKGLEKGNMYGRVVTDYKA